MIDYKDKYLKYKKKYLTLKGGVNTITLNNLNELYKENNYNNISLINDYLCTNKYKIDNQKGKFILCRKKNPFTFDIFEFKKFTNVNRTSFIIMLKLDSKFDNFAELIRSKILLDKSDLPVKQKNLHLTFFEINFNNENINIRDNYSKIIEIFNNAITEHFINKDFILNLKKYFSIFKNNLVIEYEPLDNKRITYFRTEIYKQLTIRLKLFEKNKKFKKSINKINNQYIDFKNPENGEIYFAIPWYMNGNQKWSPHVTILKMGEYNTINYEKFKNSENLKEIYSYQIDDKTKSLMFNNLYKLNNPSNFTVPFTQIIIGKKLNYEFRLGIAGKYKKIIMDNNKVTETNNDFVLLENKITSS